MNRTVVQIIYYSAAVAFCGMISLGTVAANSAIHVPASVAIAFGVVAGCLLAATIRLIGINSAQGRIMREANERLHLAILGGNIGTWDWNLGDDSTSTSPELNAQLGEAEGTLNSYDQWESRLHPNDCEKAKKVIKECLDGAADAYESIFRLRHSSGSYRRILSRGRVYRDAQGRACRMSGTHVDITQQRDLEQLFHAVFNESVQFMGILSPSGVVIDANRAALKTAGVELNDVINRPFWDTPWWSHSPPLQQRLKQSIAWAETGSLERFDATYISPDDREIHADFSIKPVCDLAGDVVYLIVEGRDVPEYCTMLKPIPDSDAEPIGNEDELRQALNAWTHAAAAISRS